MGPYFPLWGFKIEHDFLRHVVQGEISGNFKLVRICDRLFLRDEGHVWTLGDFEKISAPKMVVAFLDIGFDRVGFDRDLDL